MQSSLSSAAASLGRESSAVRRLRIGVFYNLREDFVAESGDPADAAGEWDDRGTVDLLLAGLADAGHHPVDLKDPRRLLDPGVRDQVDLVLSICEMSGSRFRESLVPALCELLGLPYMFSGPDALLVTLDKNLANHTLAQRGLPIGSWTVTPPGQPIEAPPDANLPLVVKPVAEGSGMGVRLARSEAELNEAVERVHSDYGQSALLQAYLPGREFTVAVIELAGAPRALDVLEVVPEDLDGFVYDFAAKENLGVSVELIRVDDGNLVHSVRHLSAKAFEVTGCRDGARVDLRLDEAGEPHLLDMNPLPHLHPEVGEFCKSARAAGLEYPELLRALVSSARARWSV